MLKQQIQKLVYDALCTLESEAIITRVPTQDKIQIEDTRDAAHGDYATNVALALSKATGCKPRDLAAQIKDRIPNADVLAQIQIAGPGFINFFLSADAKRAVVLDILQAQQHYADAVIGKGRSVLLEFVSANPTGPLHIGHGRGAVYGAAVATLLRKVGFKVDCEYYVNDAGRQIDILAVSTWLRYQAILGAQIDFPSCAYQGDYIRQIADTLVTKYGDRFNLKDWLVFDKAGDDEEQLDQLIHASKTQLGKENYQIICDTALASILQGIQQDLHKLGIAYQNWFSEKSLTETDLVQRQIENLKEKGYCYQKKGALWFCSSQFGDEKDRVLIRKNGETTYFAADIAYHITKFERGYHQLINIWGADHHGYIARIKAAMQALDRPACDLNILLIQFATLYRGKEKIPMSTRSGQFFPLADLYNEVGDDATRFFYLMRKAEQHLDFDIALAKTKSNENPVYYIQYAHARICSVFDQLQRKGYVYAPSKTLNALAPLTAPQEIKLLARLAKYKETVKTAAIQYAPHQLAYYLLDLANDFHCYYNACAFLVEDKKCRDARIMLIDAVRLVIVDALAVLGINAPRKM